MRDRVAFDRPAGATNDFGGTDKAWQEHHVCAAQWLYSKGDEAVEAAREAGRRRYKLRVRSSTASRSVTEAYRVRDVRRLQTWNVVSVDAIANPAWVYVVVEGPLP